MKNIVLKNTEVQILPVFCENLLIMIAAMVNVGIKPTQRIALSEKDGNAATPVLCKTVY